MEILKATDMAFRSTPHMDRVREEATWAVWSHCKRHRESLDSERHCKALQQIIVSAVEDVARHVDKMAETIMRERETVREKNRELRACRSEKAKALATIKDLEGELAFERQRVADLEAQLSDKPNRKRPKRVRKQKQGQRV